MHRGSEGPKELTVQGHEGTAFKFQVTATLEGTVAGRNVKDGVFGKWFRKPSTYPFASGNDPAPEWLKAGVECLATATEMCYKEHTWHRTSFDPAPQPSRLVQDAIPLLFWIRRTLMAGDRDRVLAALEALGV